MLLRTIKPINILNQFVAARHFAGRTGWDEYKKSTGKFGKDTTGANRIEYEKEVKDRTERKLNWNIKNRWEQRALDDVVLNKDVREAKFRDYTKKQGSLTGGVQLQEFHSVDEIYFFMEQMF
jgi:hypothetical protein